MALKIPLYLDLPVGVEGICGFEWTSRFSDKAYKHRNFYYELSCQFFNLSVLHLNYGMTLYTSSYQ